MSITSKPDLVLECFVEQELEDFKKMRDIAVEEMSQLGKMRSDEGRVSGNPLALCLIIGGLTVQMLNATFWWEWIVCASFIILLAPAVLNTIHKYSDRRIRFFQLSERIGLMNKLIAEREHWQKLTLEKPKVAQPSTVEEKNELNLN